MLSHEEMRYLVAFAKVGTLSGVAEQYHISQPTLTRAMKKAEMAFGVKLFDRTKNSIRLNDNGRFAVGEIELLLRQSDDLLAKVRVHDRASRTISIGSGAAVQLPELIRKITEANPELAIVTELKKPPELLDGLEKDIYQLIVLPFDPDNTELVSKRIGEEHLMFLLPKKHRFARRKSLTMDEMNGENILLFSDIGFWEDIVKRKMPDSRFLIQNERYSFEELVDNSVLPCFTSDLVQRVSPTESRVAVPIEDPEVNVTYYLVEKREAKKTYHSVFSS